MRNFKPSQTLIKFIYPFMMFPILLLVCHFCVPPTVYFQIYWVQWYCKFYSWTLSISFYRRYSGDRYHDSQQNVQHIDTMQYKKSYHVSTGWEHHICVRLLTIRWPFWWANLSQILSKKINKYSFIHSTTPSPQLLTHWMFIWGLP